MKPALLLATAIVAFVFVANVSRAMGQETGCTAEATAAVVHTFVRRYNSGRVVATSRLWAPEPRFRWFSAGKPHERLGRDAFNRSTLEAYFRARARVHERMRLTELAAGYDQNREIVHFGGKVLRRADDMRPTLLHFKGAADCVSGHPTLIVWSM